MVVVRASGLVMCAIADVEPWYLRAYSASIAGLTYRVLGGVDVHPGDVAGDAAGLDPALVEGPGEAIPGSVRAVHRPQVQPIAHADNPDLRGPRQ